MSTDINVHRIGIVVGAASQLPLAQEFAAVFCGKYGLASEYVYDMQLVIEEFLCSFYASVGEEREIRFFLEHQEKAVRIVFDLAGTSFDPVIADFSPMDFSSDEEAKKFMGMTVIKRMADSIRRITAGGKDEVHVILYIGEHDLKDETGRRKRYPKFRADIIRTDVDIDGNRQIRLRLADGDSYFAVTDKEEFVIRLLDGKHELAEIAAAFGERYSAASPRSIERFVNKLGRAHFLEPEVDIAFGLEYEEDPGKVTTLEKILSFQYSVKDADKLAGKVLRKFKWLLSWPAALMIAASLGVYAWQMVQYGGYLHMRATIKAYAESPWIILMYYGVMFFTITCHEFAHACTCKKYGGRVSKMGVMLYYFQLCAYADTSDAWLFKRKYQRILTSLNGPVFSLFLASLSLWLYYMIMPLQAGENMGPIRGVFASIGTTLGLHGTISPLIGHILIMVMTANILTSIFNLVPLVDSDGYYILCDILNAPNIRMTAMGYVLNFFRPLFKKAPYPIDAETWRQKIGYTVYGSLCLLYGVAAVGLLVSFFTFHCKVALHSVAGIFLLFSIFLFGLKTMFLKRIQQKREFARKKVVSY